MDGQLCVPYPFSFLVVVLYLSHSYCLFVYFSCCTGSVRRLRKLPRHYTWQYPILLKDNMLRFEFIRWKLFFLSWLCQRHQCPCSSQSVCCVVFAFIDGLLFGPTHLHLVLFVVLPFNVRFPNVTIDMNKRTIFLFSLLSCCCRVFSP